MPFPPNPMAKMDVSILHHVTIIVIACGDQEHRGLVCHVVDNKTWAHIDETWLDFTNELWNLRLAISIDDFNPFSEKLCQWSTWLVYILLYNLLSWLVIVWFFMLVSLIIPRKKSVNMNNIDVFFTPHMEELTLWMLGVQALNFA